eukprot:TRINITY_DN6248_c0_g1_i3.p1 TRINITY_DN6248_c0_g1~~TRINITY_DN6248_c0_g1_i3.p1  ORF type:complete len:355 (+),score=50.82 TRINITY_DN6248_c0_g1_i3:157-1221(+)
MICKGKIFDSYLNHLSPQVVKRAWTPQEEASLFDAHRKLGNRWTEIAKLLPGRYENSIKNHFYSLLRRSLRRLIKHIGEKRSTEKIKSIKPGVLAKLIHDPNVFEQPDLVENCLFTFSKLKPSELRARFKQGEDTSSEINPKVLKEIKEKILKVNERYVRRSLAKRKRQKVDVTSIIVSNLKKKVKLFVINRGAEIPPTANQVPVTIIPEPQKDQPVPGIIPVENDNDPKNRNDTSMKVEHHSTQPFIPPLPSSATDINSVESINTMKSVLNRNGFVVLPITTFLQLNQMITELLRGFRMMNQPSLSAIAMQELLSSCAPMPSTAEGSTVSQGPIPILERTTEVQAKIEEGDPF